MGSYIPTVSVATIRAHLRALKHYLSDKQASGEYASILNMVESGLNLYDKGSRVPVATVAQNLDLVASWLNEPNLGLKLAPYSSRQHPELDFFFRQQHFMLKDLLHVLQRYLCICTEVMTIDIQENNTAYTLVLTPAFDGISRHQQEGFVASLIALIKQTQQQEPRSVTFTHDVPEGIQDFNLYKDMLSVAPEFSSPTITLSYEAQGIGPASRRHYPFEHSFGRIRELESQRQRESEKSSWTDRSTFLLELLLCYGEPTKPIVAELLNTTPRTLQRRLEDEGVTFRELLANVRQRLVKEYLQCGNLSHEDITFLLGFKDVGVFYRAFKLWFGQSPSTFKLAGVDERPETESPT